MRLAALELRELDWAAEHPFRSALGAWSRRQGLLVVLRDHEGNVGLGEASPLPGLSVDDRTSCAAALRVALGPGTEVPEVGPALAAWSRELGARWRATPAAVFAAETAVVDLVARRQRRAAREVIGAMLERNEPPSARIPVAAVVQRESGGSWAEAVERARARDVSTLKIKIGKSMGEDVLSSLLAIRASAGRDVELRLDANGTASEAELAVLLGLLRRLHGVVLEEPVPMMHADPVVLVPLREAGAMLAADESLRPPTDGSSVASRMADGLLQALVLKPTVVGGISVSSSFASIAKSAGGAFWVSHALEGPVGYAAACELALALGPREGAPAAGLDRHPLLAAWEADATRHLDRSDIAALALPGLGLEADLVLRHARPA